MTKSGLKRFSICMLILMSICFFASFGFKMEQDVFASTSVCSVDAGTVYGNKGYVEGAGVYALGDTVTLKAFPNVGCKFVVWQKSVDAQYTVYEDIEGATDPIFSFVVEESASYRAKFDYIPYSFTSNYTTKFFDLKDVSVNTDDGIAPVDEYVRANKDNINSGKFYYGDILTLDFEHKENTYIQELDYRYLSSNTTRTKIIISVNKDGIVKTVSTGGSVEDFISHNATFEELVNANLIALNYEKNDYYILTQTEAPERLTTTHIKLITRVDRDLEFNLDGRELQMFYIKAIDENGATLDLRNTRVSELIEFKNGYYGALDRNSEVFTYLVSVGSNYEFRFSSNAYYKYQSSTLNMISTNKTITGYFQVGVTELVVNFETINYSITFSEQLKDGTNFSTLSVSPYFVIKNYKLYPNQKLKLEMDEFATFANLYIDGVAYESWEDQNAIKYGYRLVTLTDDLTSESINYSFEVTINDENPKSRIIYIVYEKIEYDIEFDVIDRSGELNSYFKEKVIGMNENKKITVGGVVELTANVLAGYNSHWTKVKGRDILDDDFLETLIFYFTPENNNNSQKYKYYLVVEYDEYAYHYSMSNFDNGAPLADINVAFISKFTFNRDSLDLIVRADLTDYSSETMKNDEEILTDTATYDETNSVYKFSWGQFSIASDANGEFLTYNGVAFRYNETSLAFERAETVKTKTITYTLAEDGDDKKRIIEFSYCVDDVILNLSSLVNATGNFRFEYFTLDEKSRLGDVVYLSSDYQKTNENIKYYSWVYAGAGEVNLRVVFAPKTQEIRVYVSDENVYSIANVSCNIQGSSDDETVESNEECIAISAIMGSVVNIEINKDQILKGYKFKEFTFKPQEGIVLADPPTAEEGSLLFSFTMRDSYKGAKITICFAEIEYSVNIISNSGFTGKYLVGKVGNVSSTTLTNTSVEINGENYFKGTFTITKSSLINTPKLNLISNAGHFIYDAYILYNETQKEQLDFLTGNVGEATDKTINFADVVSDELTYFVKYIQEFADEDGVVNIYILQSQRTYAIYINLKINGEVNLTPIKNAKVTLKIAGQADKTATPNGSGVISFTDIKYGEAVALTLDESEITRGVSFTSWHNEDGDTLREDYTYSWSITDETSLEARFNCWDYYIDFKIFLEEGDVSDQIGAVLLKTYDMEKESEGTSYDNLTTDTKTSFNVCDEVTMEISEAIGYKFKTLYYTYGVSHTSRDGIGNDGLTYSFDLSGLNNMHCFSRDRFTKEEEKGDANKRTLTLYLVFNKKEYEIVTTVNNSTVGAQDPSTDGWLDIKVEYKNGTEYMLKEADEKDGKVRYSTNTQIKITFTKLLRGINFESVNLGDKNIVIDKLGDNALSGQTMVLSVNDDEYSIEFYLSTSLLEKADGDVFNTVINFYKKKYTITFIAGQYGKYETKDGKIVGSDAFTKLPEKFQLSLGISINVTSYRGNSSGAHEVTASSIEWGLQLVFSVSSATTAANNNNFKNCFNFLYFQIGDKFCDQVSDGQHDDYSISSINEAIWDYVNESDQTLTVYAVYMPKVTVMVELVDGYYTVTYNGKEQVITTSLSEGVDHPHLNFDTDTFTTCLIKYNGGDTPPINVGEYSITLILDGTEFSDIFKLKIKPCVVEFYYKGGAIQKPYDGNTSFIEANGDTVKNGLTLKIVGQEYTGKNFLCVSSDTIELKFDWRECYFASEAVGDNITVYVNSVSLGENLARNYVFTDGQQNYTTYTAEINGWGEILPVKAKIDITLFSFKDIVYKDNVAYVLKYNETDLLDGLGQFKEDYNFTIINKVTKSDGSPEDEVYFNKDKIRITLEDYSVGVNKKIIVSLKDAIAGANSGNYTIDDVEYFINIYPYKLIVNLENGTQFMIVDRDELCCIPIDLGLEGKLYASYIDSTNPDYPNLFLSIEKLIKNDDRIHAFYEFELNGSSGNVYEVNNLRGAYIGLPKVKGLKAIYERTESGYVQTEYFVEDGNIFYKISSETRGGNCVIVDRSYFPIWKIILIVVLILLLIGIFWFILLLLKRRREKNDDEYHAKMK